MKNPNILIIMCDQMRGDCLSYKGHPDVKTPSIDNLVADGYSFDSAYSSCPSCIPARVGFLTGQSQSAHGRVGYQDGVDWNYQNYLPEVFTNHGYQSHCVGKMHTHPIRNRCGFESLQLHDGYLDFYRSLTIPHFMHQDVSDDYLFDLKNTLGHSVDFTDTGLQCNSFVVNPWPYAQEMHPTNWVSNNTIRFLKTRDRQKPFFLMASYVRPHPPFDAPEYYLNLYKDKITHIPAENNYDFSALHPESNHFYDSIFGTTNSAVQKEAIAGYFASITHLDHQLNRIIQTLKEDGSFEDTIIVFTSDHGEMLFDHQFFRKALPYQGSVHIPMVFRIGKNIASSCGSSNSVVELRDIMPTLLDLADIPIPTTVDGLSLKDELIKNEPIPREFLHGEHTFISQLSSQFIISKNYKYIWFPETNKEQFFNLKEDPNETIDEIKNPKYANLIAEHKNYLISELAHREEGYSDGVQLFKNSSPLLHLTKVRKVGS